MKKLIALITAVVLAIGGISARDRVYNSSEPLPAEAKTMLKKYFPLLKVNHVKVDKDLLSTEYEVILSDGTEVDFNKDGDWKSIDRGQKAVPDALVLKPIREYVAKAYPGQKIVDIDKDRKGYEVTLTRGLELEFDTAGVFKKVDR